MKKYTLKKLKELDNLGALIGKDLGGIRVELMGSGRWCYYKVFTNDKYNGGVYSTPEQELTIGLVKAVNKYIKEV